MQTWLSRSLVSLPQTAAKSVAGLFAVLAMSALALAQPEAEHGGGEAALKLPNLHDVFFIGGFNGHNLLLVGLVFCALGLLFGLAIYTQLKNLPVHRSMRDISELIY